jgi:small subunit ribosomal protein S3
LRADIDYGFSEAKTTYGVIGVKCWVYKGDTLGRNEAPAATDATPAPDREDRRPRRGEGRPDSRPAGKAPAKRPRKTAEVKVEPTVPVVEKPKDDPAKPVVKRVRKVAAKSPTEGGAKDGE